jgi:hypothetical protein
MILWLAQSSITNLEFDSSQTQDPYKHQRQGKLLAYNLPKLEDRTIAKNSANSNKLAGKKNLTDTLKWIIYYAGAEMIYTMHTNNTNLAPPCHSPSIPYRHVAHKSLRANNLQEILVSHRQNYSFMTCLSFFVTLSKILLTGAVKV